MLATRQQKRGMIRMLWPANGRRSAPSAMLLAAPPPQIGFRSAHDMSRARGASGRL